MFEHNVQFIGISFGPYIVGTQTLIDKSDLRKLVISIGLMFPLN